MARQDSEFRVTPSVLDRLIDLEPRESREAPKSRSTSLQELKASVRRDLEWLLNTRSQLDITEPGHEEVKKSVAYYGLPDFTGLSAKNPGEIHRLSSALEMALRFFEPRLLDLKVTLEPISAVDRELRFRLEAKLDVDPAPEPIAFDTVLEIGSGEFGLREK